MASYVPFNILDSKAMGNGSGNIATWQKQNTLGAGSFYIARTLVFDTPTAARTVVVEIGATATATTAQQILPTQALTANVATIINGWFAIANNNYLQGYANNTDINASAYGVQYS